MREKKRHCCDCEIKGRAPVGWHTCRRPVFVESVRQGGGGSRLVWSIFYCKRHAHLAGRVVPPVRLIEIHERWSHEP